MSNDQKHPIVLAHGIARFDVLLELLRKKLKLPETRFGDQFQYFKGIKTHLEAHGFKVFHPNQDFAGSVELRAEQLKARVNEAIAETGSERVHIIAHSMGGLDARHMIVDKGMAERVASVYNDWNASHRYDSGRSRHQSRGSVANGPTPAGYKCGWIRRLERQRV